MEEEASTASLISLQPSKKRCSPAILSRLLRRGNKRAACKSWQQDGMKLMTNVEHFEKKMSTVYFWGARTVFAGESVLEIILDSSMFGTQDYQVHVMFAPRKNMAAYLPPTIMRHLRWRKEDAGLPISGEERSKFEATGFQPHRGQSIEDHIRCLHHVLKIGANEDEGLLKFKCPVEFKPLESGEARIWSEEKQCWLRQRGTPTSGVMKDSSFHEEDGCPELPEEMRNV